MDLKNLPEEVINLIYKRQTLRYKKRFAEADVLRRNLEKKGYLIKDTLKGSEIFRKNEDKEKAGIKPGLIVLFGSGEMSPTGKRIHEEVIELAELGSPLKIGILETPTGYEVNALHSWPVRMEKFFNISLKNLHPRITRIRAWQNKGKYSTNNPEFVDKILNQNFIYAGAGSPSYVVKHLNHSLAWYNMMKANEKGAVLSFGSATAIAIGKFVLPVYEIFKAGSDLFWLPGLDLFESFNLNLTVIPHWNNQEGEDFDTTRCYMGKRRFSKLLRLLPQDKVILGIDELTAIVFNFKIKKASVLGKGSLTVIKNQESISFQTGSQLSFANIML